MLFRETVFRCRRLIVVLCRFRGIAASSAATEEQKEEKRHRMAFST